MGSNKNRFTKEQDDLLRQYYGFVTPKELEKLVGRPYISCKSRASKQLGLTFRTTNKHLFTQKEEKFLKKHYSYAEKEFILKNVNTSWSNIQAFCSRKGIKRLKYIISDEEREEIISLYVIEGLTQLQIAKKIHRGLSVVGRVTSGLVRKKFCGDCDIDISNEKHNTSRDVYCKSCYKKREIKWWKKSNAKEINRLRRLEYGRTEQGKWNFRLGRLKRRARKTKQPFNLTIDKLKRIHRRDNNICVYCGLPDQIPGIAHIDHIIPVSKGGTWSVNNLVVSCKHCNLEKHNKDVYEWHEIKGEIIPKKNLSLLEIQRSEKQTIVKDFSTIKS